jgi:hypothetical protein
MHMNQTRLSELPLVMFAIGAAAGSGAGCRVRIGRSAHWEMRVGADAFVLVTDQHSPFRLRC